MEDEDMKVTEAGEYAGMVKRHKAAKKTYLFKLPSKAVFELVRMELLEALELFEIIGVKMEDLGTIKNEDFGLKMMGGLKKILDHFLPRMVRRPRIYPSTSKKTDKEILAEKAIRVDDLDVGDQWELIQEIRRRATGGGAQAKAESFPEEPSDKGGGKAGEGVQSVSDG